MNNQPLTILSGDIGGTTSRLQLSSLHENQSLDLIKKDTYKNDQFECFTKVLEAFLDKSELGSIDRACLAFAGPIANGTVTLTNAPWSLSENKIKQFLNTEHTVFINDFEAIAYAIPRLDASDHVVMRSGYTKSNGVQLIVGAGTGLGTSIIHQSNNTLSVLLTEAGHCEFAPMTNLQIELLHFLKKKLHRVSVERIVSGIGITSIYRFVRTLPGFTSAENSKLKRLALSSNNFSDEISYFAHEHNDALALKTLEIFIECYGSYTGNMALSTLPYGGIFIAGGIAPKLERMMNDGRFVHAYQDKGRMSNLLEKIPISLITDTHIGLKGAAYYAAYGNALSHE